MSTEEEPTVWSLPLLPGPEVTHVRDARNWVWTRDARHPEYWSVEGRTDENGCYPESRTDHWTELLAWCGPLTDATKDYQ